MKKSTISVKIIIIMMLIPIKATGADVVNSDTGLKSNKLLYGSGRIPTDPRFGKEHTAEDSKITGDKMEKLLGDDLNSKPAITKPESQ